MTHFTTDLVQTLVTKQDIREIFRIHLEKAINLLLETESTVFVDYKKYDRSGFNSGNPPNGSYSQTLHTEYVDLHLQIPRDRQGEFNQQTVVPYKRSNDTLESFVIHFFQKSIMMTEIAELIEKMYGHHYTPQTVSNMTQVLTAQVYDSLNRRLAERYVCVYLDATYITVKRETVSKEAVYIAIGIREDGSKEVMGYTIAPTDSSYNWKELLEIFPERGTEDVLFFISDGLKGMTEAAVEVFPNAKSQTCCVHLVHNQFCQKW